MVDDMDAARGHFRSIGEPESAENEAVGQRSEKSEEQQGDLVRQQETGRRRRTGFRRGFAAADATCRPERCERVLVRPVSNGARHRH